MHSLGYAMGGFTCSGCGAVVALKQAHDAFHARLEALTTMAAEAHKTAENADQMLRPLGGTQ